MRLAAILFMALGPAFAVNSGALPAGASKDAQAERIAALIRQLGHEEFAKREEATKELIAIGAPALPALRKAAAGDDLEISRRAQRIIQAIADQLTKRHLEKLQGTWFLVSYETDGRQIKGEDNAHLFIFKDNKWSLQVGGQLFQGGTVQRIEAKAKIHEIDLLITEGSNIGATAVSIYALEGDALKYLNSGDPRPTDFTTKPGDGRHYLRFRRAQP